MRDKRRKETEPTADHLKRWPGLTIRQGDEIVEASPDDVAVAQSYATVKDKGEIVGGKRLTILTKTDRYKLDEEVRVVHIMEIVEPGHQLFVMGPKRIYGEHVDGELATPATAPPQGYDGLVLDSPEVDYNYDITSYRFSQPGIHHIYWEVGGLRSNTITLEVVADD